jgi:hypothetical protein
MRNLVPLGSDFNARSNRAWVGALKREAFTEGGEASSVYLYRCLEYVTERKPIDSDPKQLHISYSIPASYSAISLMDS